MSPAFVVSNRGPLTFRSGPDDTLVPVPAAGGLASSMYRILEGSGTTWASVTMGAADREAVTTAHTYSAPIENGRYGFCGFGATIGRCLYIVGSRRVDHIAVIRPNMLQNDFF